MDTTTDPIWIRAWKPSVPGIREVFHAQFGEHAYPPHTHDAWTLFLVDDGSIRYDLNGHAQGALPSMVSILPPHVVHDGRPASSRGFRKRVLYLETSVVGEDLIGAAVDRPILSGRSLRADVSAIHDLLGCADDAIEAEVRLGFVAERIRESLGRPPTIDHHPAGMDLAEQLRAFLDARLSEPVTMAAAAEAIGTGSTQLARAFTRTFGIAPHAYVMGRRVDAARDRILRGQPLAEVAADVGFFDQAHLSRRFRRYLGTTPGRFADGAAAWRQTPERRPV